MGIVWAWLSSPEFLILAGFHAFIVFMLALDLGLVRRQAKSVTMKDAACWSAVWIGLALAFALLGIRKHWDWWNPQEPELGPARSLEFITGYLVEFSLSIDNLFVFLVIFRYFGVPEPLRHRVLFWGILGAVILRAAFILCGVALLNLFHWTIYLFGVILLWTAYKMLRAGDEDIDPAQNPVLRFAKRVLPLVHDYDSPRFWVRRDGRWYATPLPLVLLVVESSDVMFAVDSIPAIFGITRDPFIVYTSNIFAILGLRSLYFLLANFLGMFRFLKVGLGAVLGFVGVKMLTDELLEPVYQAWGIGQAEKILISLAAIVTILATAVIASLWIGPKRAAPDAPEATTTLPPPVVGTVPVPQNPDSPPAPSSGHNDQKDPNAAEEVNERARS